MSKTLLSESEIKDFMKYANLGKDATKTFLGRLNEHSLAEAEGDEPEEEAPEEAPEGEEGPEGEELPPEEGGEEGAEELEEPGAAGEDEGVEAAVETVLQKIVDAIGEIPGAPEISMQAGEEGGADMELPPEEGAPEEAPEEEAPEEAPEEGAPEEGDEDMEAMMEALNLYMAEDAGEYEDEMMEEDLLDEDYFEEGYEDEEMMDLEEDGMEGFYDDDSVAEDIVNEVTRRVARRILNANKSRRR